MHMRARMGLSARVCGGGRGRHVGTTTTEEHKSALRLSVNGDSMCVRTRVHAREQVEVVRKGLIYAINWDTCRGYTYRKHQKENSLFLG